MQLSPEIQKRVTEWLTGDYDQKTKDEIKILTEKQLNDVFYDYLSFGTGGIRALMDVGTNRLNRYTIQMITQGLANYLHHSFKDDIAVMIGYDNRHNSRLFAEETAKVLAGNNIKAYLLKEMRPTPFVSFACRYNLCKAAIMITASHNPPEYNGYKVYWEDGAQVLSPHDKGIVTQVQEITSIKQVHISELTSDLIVEPGADLDQAYLKAIELLQHYPERNAREGKNLKITYTSLHGTGATLMKQALSSWGFSNINYVESQMIPSGDFPTVKSPNPESIEALEMGIKQMLLEKSDLLIATDPDADRVGVVIRDKDQAIAFNGNQIAVLCAHFLCDTLQKLHRLPENGALVTTIVTTELLGKIAERYQISCFEVLTGFKYIGEKIRQWEDSSEGYQFLFGAEESYGYLIGTHARDKDAIATSCLIAEITSIAKSQGKTLQTILNEIYSEYGYFLEKQKSFQFAAGQQGIEEIANIMKSLREKQPMMIGKNTITHIEDYENGKSMNIIEGKETLLSLPCSNVLIYRLEDQSKIVIRPSGTEPKLKIYAAVCQPSLAESEKKISELLKDSSELLQS